MNQILLRIIVTILIGVLPLLSFAQDEKEDIFSIMRDTSISMEERSLKVLKAGVVELKIGNPELADSIYSVALNLGIEKHQGLSYYWGFVNKELYKKEQAIYPERIKIEYRDLALRYYNNALDHPKEEFRESARRGIDYLSSTLWNSAATRMQPNDSILNLAKTCFQQYLFNMEGAYPFEDFSEKKKVFNLALGSTYARMWENSKEDKYFDLAIETYQKVLEIEPRNVTAMFNMPTLQSNRNEMLLQEEKELLRKESIKLQDQKFINKAIIVIAIIILLLLFFAIRNYLIQKKQNVIIENNKNEISLQHDLLSEKSKEINDSITYAKRIQSAILPPLHLIQTSFADSFVLYEPKDVISGDFYWLIPKANDGSTIIAAADCTGHGVPGAMVSVICNSALNRSAKEFGLSDPGEILTKTRELVIEEFEKSSEEVKDGMDIALCSLKGQTLKYSGAYNPLWIIRNGSAEVEEIKAHKQAIGSVQNPSSFPTHTLELNSGDSIYVFSDGFVDQFGGEKGKKFKSLNFKQLLLANQNKSMEEQGGLLSEAFATWKGDIEQIDDVCVIGFRI